MYRASAAARPLDRRVCLNQAILMLRGKNVVLIRGVLWSMLVPVQLSDLSEGELYTFYVQAVNAYGTSGASPALTVVAALPAGELLFTPARSAD